MWRPAMTHTEREWRDGRPEDAGLAEGTGPDRPAPLAGQVHEGDPLVERVRDDDPLVEPAGGDPLVEPAGGDPLVEPAGGDPLVERVRDDGPLVEPAAGEGPLVEEVHEPA